MALHQEERVLLERRIGSGNASPLRQGVPFGEERDRHVRVVSLDVQANMISVLQDVLLFQSLVRSPMVLQCSMSIE